MIRMFIVAAALAGATILPALAAEPIVGTWIRPSTGTLVTFSPCASGFCGTVQNGEHAGKSIGAFNGSGGSYSGKITDLSEDKTYTGKASVEGDAMDLKGCVLGGLICRGETWQRQ